MHATNEIRLSGTPVFLSRVASVPENASYKRLSFSCVNILNCVLLLHNGNIVLDTMNIQTGPGAHPASYTMGTWSFTGVKRPGRGVDLPLPPRAGVKESVELYLYSPSGHSWPGLGPTFTFAMDNIQVSTNPPPPKKKILNKIQAAYV